MNVSSKGCNKQRCRLVGFSVFLRKAVHPDAGMVVLAVAAVAATSRAAVEATSKVAVAVAAAVVAAVALAAAMTVRIKSSAVHDSMLLGFFPVAD